METLTLAGAGASVSARIATDSIDRIVAAFAVPYGRPVTLEEVLRDRLDEMLRQAGELVTQIEVGLTTPAPAPLDYTMENSDHEDPERGHEGRSRPAG